MGTTIYPDSPPYFESEETVGNLILRRTKASDRYPWMRWQAGRTEFEVRHYHHRHSMISPFYEGVNLFRLLGYGETAEEALIMARKR